MKKNKQELDAIIEKAAHQIRDEHIDASTLDASAARIWAAVSAHASALDRATSTSQMEGTNIMNSSNNTEQIRGCDDFQSLIPAYLDGKLSPARKLLLQDHSNECIPCRQELKAQRNLANARAATFVAPQHVSRDRKASPRAGAGLRNATIARWSIAAAVVLAVGVAGLFMYERLDLSGRTMAATVENTSGGLYVVSDNGSRELAAGEQLQKGERVRTAKDSNAVLRLADGSSVEMRERSEFSVSENMRGVTIKLDRGDVIVEAAKQHNGRLYVQTPDSLVSVKGTIFAVESGTKGSRVSVVEGEVKVDHAGKNETLLPGDQTTTSANLEKAPVDKTVAWSRNAARYASVVSELGKLRQDISQKVERPGVRHESKFVDLVSENTVFYAALPNLSETLAQSQQIMQDRIKQNPALEQWWKDGKHGIDQKLMTRIHDLGSQLGDEIVVTAEMDSKGEPSGVLVLGQVKDAASFRTYLNGEIAKVAAENRDMPNIQIIDDPLTARTAAVAPRSKVRGKDAGSNELYVWISNDIFAASPTIESLRTFATTLKAPSENRFANSTFHQRISDIYKEGAGLVVAADVQKIVGKVISKDTSPEATAHLEGLKRLGVTNLRDFVAEQKEVGGKTLSRAVLSFTESDHGIPSWLAAPGSMGSLEFISPNANVVTAFVVKEPTLLVDDLLGFIETVKPDVRAQLQEIEKQQGFSLRDDFAAPLGGEFAFAIDGPILPTPSWKVILEVYDQAKLQSTFERAIERLNEFAVLHGKGRLTLEKSSTGGHDFYSISSDKGGLQVYYAYANGYLIAAQSRALLDQAISNRDAGNTLVRSSRFMSSLPQDGNLNFSAILYHDLAPLMGPLADRMKNVGDGKLAAIDPNAPPTLAYAYAEGDRITLSANTEGGAFGLSPASLIGLPNSFEMQHILMNAMGDKDVRDKE